MAQKVFIPEISLVELTEGSYERLLGDVQKAVQESAEKLLNIKECVELCGTFKGYAIVCTENRDRVFRIKYEISERGEVLPLSGEEIELRSYTPNQYVAFQAKAFVESFMSGAKTEAGEYLKRIVKLIPRLEHAPAEEKVVPSIADDLANISAAEKTWKKIFEDKLSSINKALGSELDQLSESKLKPKFRKLQDGTISGPGLESYRPLVTSDLKYLSERFDATFGQVTKAVDAYKGAVPALKTESADPTIKMFESFSRDYLTDLTDLRNKLTEASNIVNAVDELGKIYDLLSTHLYRYEVAGRFIEKMSGNLVKVPTEDS